MGRDELRRVLTELEISIESDFIPWSKSRHAQEKHRTLNWDVHVKRSGQRFMSAQYSAGIAYCPSYSAMKKGLPSYDELIEYETEYGYSAISVVNRVRHPILPDICGVMESLVMDSGAIDFADFDDWASSLGCDTDSRAAEKTYQACLETGLKLRAALGEDGLRKLSEAVWDC